MAERGIQVAITEGENVLVDLELASRSILVGSGAHCDVRLGPDQLASEQLSILDNDGQLYLDARTASPPLLVDGQHFSRGPLLSGQRVTVGDLCISATLSKPDDVGGAKGDPVRRVLLVLLVLMLALVGGMLLIPEEGLRQAPKTEASPFGAQDKAAPTCPEDGPEAALAAARELSVSARDRRERGPFDARDAVEAVRLYATLGECLKVAGEAETAREATATSVALREDIEDRFHVHRVRLEHALSTRNLEAALKEVRTLTNFLSGQEGPYVAWLDYIDRKLKVKQSKKVAKK